MSKELKTVLVIGGIIIAIVAVLIAVARHQASTKPLPEEALVRDNSHYTGAVDASVTLVEFGDFQCPACGQAEPVVQQLRQEYGDKLKFVYRNFPLSFHQHAQLAAQAAEAAGLQGKFWEMHDQLFVTQSDWSAVTDPTSQFKDMAKQLGLDEQKFADDLFSQTVQDIVRADQRDGEALGVTGTPSFYLNGDKQDSWAYASLKQKIDQLLAQDEQQEQASVTASPVSE